MKRLTIGGWRLTQVEAAQIPRGAQFSAISIEV